MSQNQPQPNTTPTPVPSTSSANPPPSSSASTTTQVSVPQNAPAGGIFMTQPPETAVSFFKIAPSQTVNFGWNFTQVVAQPESLTVSAVCENGNTYPVGPTDGILPGTATQVSWDLNVWQVNNLQQPLVPGTCTLRIWDQRGPSALPRPGFLKPFDGLQFAFYTPVPYTALSDGWSCIACNAGVASAVLHPAFVGIAVSFLVIFLSGFQMLRIHSI